MRLFALIVVGSISLSPEAAAQAPYDDPGTAAGWAWAQIRNDQIADFSSRKGCNGTLDPHVKTGWDNSCRQIPAQFLVDVLTNQKLLGQVRQHGVRLRGARVNGVVDLTDAEIPPEVWIDASRVEGDLILSGSHWNEYLSIEGSALLGKLDANGMRIERDINLQHAVVEADVDLSSAKLGGVLAMANSRVFGKISLVDTKIGGYLGVYQSSFTGVMDANHLSVAGFLYMDRANFANVKLVGAKIGGDLDMSGSAFAGVVNGNSLNVIGNLIIGEHAKFGLISLAAAKVGGSIDIEDALITQAMIANNVEVGRHLAMRETKFGAQVKLEEAKIGGDLDLSESSFTGAPISLLDEILGDTAAEGGCVDLASAKIGRTLALTAATVWQVDLSAADAQELQLGYLGWWCAGGQAPTGIAASASPGDVKPHPVHWELGNSDWRNVQCERKDSREGNDPKEHLKNDPSKSSDTLPALILRNAHVDDFQDSSSAWRWTSKASTTTAWGGAGGDGPDDMRRRSPQQWADWLARDRTFSTQPYTELSSVLAATGHRDTADAVQLAGRERERGETCKAWNRPVSCAWLSFLSSAAGYGIGLYTFRVLRWVVGLTVLGAVILWFSPNARRQGLLWLFGASLHRLLPIIELSKEFTNFSDNPPPQFDEEPNLNRLQVAYFAGHAVAGWILSLILLAAMSGITQKS
jgi:hypothetical protein